MKNSINILLACLIVVGMASCDTAGGIDSFQIGEESALAAWVSSPSGDLILSDPSSALDFEVEFIDATDGSSVEAFNMTVTDGTNTGTIVSQTAFTANENGNQGFSGSISLNDIATALGVTVASLEEDDEFDFTSTITRGGTVLATGNASQFITSVRNFSVTIATETVDVAVTVKTAKIGVGLTSTVVMAFENDFTVALETLPTLEIINGGSGSFGAVTAVPYMDEDDEDNFGNDSVYQVVYTPGAIEETVSFRVIGASALASGFVMTPDTISKAFTMDLTAPTIVGDNSATSTSGQLYNLLLDENIGSVTLMQDFTGVDDDGENGIDDADDAIKVADVTFDKNVLNYTFDWQASDGEVTLTLVVKDESGNELVLPAGLATVVLN